MDRHHFGKIRAGGGGSRCSLAHKTKKAPSRSLFDSPNVMRTIPDNQQEVKADFKPEDFWRLCKEAAKSISKTRGLSTRQAAIAARKEVLEALSDEERAILFRAELEGALDRLETLDPEERSWRLAQNPRLWQAYLTRLPESERKNAIIERRKLVVNRLEGHKEHDRQSIMASSHLTVRKIWEKHLKFQVSRHTPSGQQSGNPVAKGAGAGSPALTPNCKRKALSREELMAVFAAQDAKASTKTASVKAYNVKKGELSHGV